MQLSIQLRNLLKDVLTLEELNSSPSVIRNLLEDKIDFAKQNTIDFNIKFPNGDITIAKEDLQTIEKLQKLYNFFMYEYEEYLDNKEKTIINN